MTGPEHYKEAERLLAASDGHLDTPRENTVAAECIAAAQVHATLALAAATIDAPVIDGQQGHVEKWQEALS